MKTDQIYLSTYNLNDLIRAALFINADDCKIPFTKHSYRALQNFVTVMLIIFICYSYDEPHIF